MAINFPGSSYETGLNKVFGNKVPRKKGNRERLGVRGDGGSARRDRSGPGHPEREGTAPIRRVIIGLHIPADGPCWAAAQRRTRSQTAEAEGTA